MLIRSVASGAIRDSAHIATACDRLAYHHGTSPLEKRKLLEMQQQQQQPLLPVYRGTCRKFTCALNGQSFQGRCPGCGWLSSAEKSLQRNQMLLPPPQTSAGQFGGCGNYVQQPPPQQSAGGCGLFMQPSMGFGSLGQPQQLQANPFSNPQGFPPTGSASPFAPSHPGGQLQAFPQSGQPGNRQTSPTTLSKSATRRQKLKEKNAASVTSQVPPVVLGAGAPQAAGAPVDNDVSMAATDVETEESVLTRKIARLDAKANAISNLANQGDTDAKQEVLELQALKQVAMEARTRLKSPAEQVKTLTLVLAGKKKHLKKTEDELALAREDVATCESEARSAKHVVEKLTLELERAEALRVPGGPPKIELDAPTIQMLANLQATFAAFDQAGTAVKWDAVDSRQGDALKLVLNQATAHQMKVATNASGSAQAGAPVVDITGGGTAQGAAGASSRQALPPHGPVTPPQRPKRSIGSPQGGTPQMAPMSPTSPVPASQHVHAMGVVTSVGSSGICMTGEMIGEALPKQQCVLISDDLDLDLTVDSGSCGRSSASSGGPARNSFRSAPVPHTEPMALHPGATHNPQQAHMPMQHMQQMQPMNAAQMQQMQHMMQQMNGGQMQNGNQVFQVVPVPVALTPMVPGNYGPVVQPHGRTGPYQDIPMQYNQRHAQQNVLPILGTNGPM